MAPNDNGQMAHIVRESREWVQTHGFNSAATNLLTVRDALRISLASDDYMVERISQRLAAPMWAVALGVGGGLLVNAGIQVAKWVLGG